MGETAYSPRDLAYWYCLGVQHERERASAARAELDASWTRSGAVVAADRRSQMLRLLRLCAEDFAERGGHTYVEYRGGPVVWQ